MKRSLSFILSLCIIFSLTGCALWRPFGAKKDKNKGFQALPPYSGPRARIAESDFEIKAAKATGEIGSDLKEILIAALTKTNRFSVVERKDSDLIITATLDEFEPQVSGGRGGIGGGGGVGSGTLGGLLGTSLNNAHMSLEIRIIDTATSTVLASSHITGQASDAGGSSLSELSGVTLGTGLSAYANTPMDKAMRICIVEAVRYIAQAVPQEYYKH